MPSEEHLCESPSSQKSLPCLRNPGTDPHFLCHLMLEHQDLYQLLPFALPLPRATAELWVGVTPASGFRGTCFPGKNTLLFHPHFFCRTTQAIFNFIFYEPPFKGG